MSILDQKRQVFGDIAALRTLTEGIPQLKVNSSFPSINNNGDSIAFLCDLIRALIGYDALQQTVVDTLVYSLKDIEKEVKAALKTELKSIVSCGVNPSLPSFIKSTGLGVKFTVNKVDFTNLMQIIPTSDVGKLLYNDLKPNLLDSTDFNTFLYQTIQNDGATESWGHSTFSSDILDILFKSADVSHVDPNNTITVKAHPTYDNKTLTELNNNYVDSISLFNTENLLTNIIDMAFGTLSNAANKSLTQLQSEAQINTVVNKIVNSDSKDIISDKYFTFTNEEQNAQQEQAKLRKSGLKVLDTSTQFSSSIPFTSIQTLNANIGGAANQIDKNVAVSTSLNQIGGQLGSFTNIPADHQAIKLNFIQEIINNLINAIVNSILSPKVIMIFIINYKIIYGENATYTDAIDFLKKNKNLIHNISKKIAGLIIKVLMTIALKQISTLVAEGIALQQIDKNKANLTQLLSLIGVPQDTLRQIKGLL